MISRTELPGYSCIPASSAITVCTTSASTVAYIAALILHRSKTSGESVSAQQAVLADAAMLSPHAVGRLRRLGEQMQADAILLVGTNLRHEVPLLHHRVRQAWKRGAKVYAANCQACHQANGQGP